MVSVACGYAFDKYQFRHKEKLFGLVLAGVNGAADRARAAAVPDGVRHRTGQHVLGGVHPGVVQPVRGLPRPDLQPRYVPDEVLEAARMDGASELKMYARVALRMLDPVWSRSSSSSSPRSGKLLPADVMLSDQKLYPVSLGMFTWNSSANVSPEYYPVVIMGSLLAICR